MHTGAVTVSESLRSNEREHRERTATCSAYHDRRKMARYRSVEAGFASGSPPTLYRCTTFTESTCAWAIGLYLKYLFPFFEILRVLRTELLLEFH